MRSFRRLGASWLARGVALSLITSSIALGPAHPAAAATGDPFRFIYDQDGRLRAAVTPTDSAKWTYDAVGNITAISRQAATTLSVIEFASHAGPVGATVHIYGTAFSTTPGSNTVKFNGTLATVSSSTTPNSSSRSATPPRRAPIRSPFRARSRRRSQASLRRARPQVAPSP